MLEWTIVRAPPQHLQCCELGGARSPFRAKRVLRIVAVASLISIPLRLFEKRLSSISIFLANAALPGDGAAPPPTG
jgi:hypothetical protein